MTFLNKKERVLDIELTSLGKELLAYGQFKPIYYAFFDDDILYETRFANYKEIPNSSSVRIKETPVLEAQSHYAGLETEINKNNNSRRIGESGFILKPIQVTPDKHYSLTNCLGNMAIEADKKPAWSVNVLKGEISGVISTKQGGHPNEQIPQINLKDVEFTIKVKQGNLSEELDLNGTFSDLNLLNEQFNDGSFIDVTEREVVLEITESNTDYLNENFEMEIFEITSGSTINSQEREVLVPLYFQQRQPLIINDILIDDDREIEPAKIDGTFVENYFELFSDSEIPEISLCNLNPINSNDNQRNQKDLNCIKPNKDSFQAKDIYKSFVTEENIEEDC